MTEHCPGVAPTCAGTLPPLRENVGPPATAVTVPPQVLVVVSGLAMVTPAGKVSVHAALDNEKLLGLKIETVRVDSPPEAMEIGAKFLFSSAGNEACAETILTGEIVIEAKVIAKIST